QVQALVKIEDRFSIDSASVLLNQPAGIFGDNVLSFTSPPSDLMPDPLPKDGSAVVVAGSTFLDQAQGQAEQILAGMADLLADESVADLRATFKNARSLTDNGAALLAGLQQHDGQLGKTLAAVEKLAAGLEDSRGRMDKQLHGVLEHVELALQSVRVSSEMLAADVHKVADDAEAFMAGGATLMTNTDAMLNGEQAKLAGALTDLQAAAASLKDLLVGIENGRGVVGQLMTSDALARDLNDTVITTHQVVERVADNPDVLVWGNTPDEREEARRAREKRMIRRAFMEGYRYREAAVTDPAVQDLPDEAGSTAE
nr:hypothetical protein [Planctomycetota bacterium]